MVKISDFLSTDKRVALQQNSYADEATKQLADRGLQAEGAYVNEQLNKATQEQAKAKNSALQAQQLKAQEKYQLNNIFGNLQEVQLKTISTLSAIDEANRKQQESTQASAHVLKVGVDYQLQAKEKMNEIVSSSAKDGSDIRGRFQDWHNEFWIGAEQAAPNATAIASLKNMNADGMVKFGGAAIDAAENRRTMSVVNDINESANKTMEAARKDPANYDPAINILGIRAILEGNGTDPAVVEQNMKRISAGIYSAQVDGFVEQMDFTSAKALLMNPQAKKLLTPEQLSQQFDVLTKTQIGATKEQFKQQKVSEAAFKWESGDLSPLDGENLNSDVKKELGTLITGKMDSVLSSTADRSTKLTTIADVLKGNPWQPKEVFDYIESKMLVGGNEEKVILSNAIDKLYDDKQTTGLTDKLKKEVFIESQLIAKNSRSMTDEDAVTQAINLFRAPTIDRDFKEFETTLASITVKDIQQESGITSKVKGFFGLSSSVEAEVSPELYGEFTQMAKLAYSKGKSEDDALAIAYKFVGGLYSTTEINGTPEIVEIAPEKIFGTSGLLKDFNSVLDANMQIIAEQKGWKLSEDKRSYSVEENGNIITAPLKVMPLPGITAIQYKEGSGTTSWMIVDGRDGYQDRNFQTFEVNDAAFREVKRKQIQEQEALELDVIKRFKKDNEDFKKNILSNPLEYAQQGVAQARFGNTTLPKNPNDKSFTDTQKGERIKGRYGNTELPKNEGDKGIRLPITGKGYTGE